MWRRPLKWLKHAQIKAEKPLRSVSPVLYIIQLSTPRYYCSITWYIPPLQPPSINRFSAPGSSCKGPKQRGSWCGEVHSPFVSGKSTLWNNIKSLTMPISEKHIARSWSKRISPLTRLNLGLWVWKLESPPFMPFKTNLQSFRSISLLVPPPERTPVL